MEEFPQRPARASVAPDLKLPPIVESGLSSPTSSKSSKSRNNDNPFRKNARRISVATSNTSSIQSEMSSRGSKMASKNRRLSLAEKRSSIDLSKSEKIMEKMEAKRRQSMANLTQHNKRLSFGTVGSRVTALLRAKNAFSMLRLKTKQFEDETPADDKAFEIEDLPPSPRFASTLSDEAQYAMMKGYEDVVYSNLCVQYPEYRTMLRRNRTPLAGITVSAQKGLIGKGKEDHKSSEVKDKPEHVHDSPDGEANEIKPDSHECDGPATTSTPKSRRISSFECYDNSPVPSAHQSSRDILTGSPLSKSKKRMEHTTPETKKKLVMTYRYQSAMDILDNLRQHQGVHSLSPRVKQNYQLEPLKEYNTWSYVWTHEFEPKKMKRNKLTPVEDVRM